MAPLRRERLAAGFARLVVRLRFLVLPAWVAAAVAATLTLPGLGSGEPLPLGGLVPRDSEAVDTGERAARLFSVPLTTDTVVVQRDPDGLSADAQRRAVERAVTATRQDARSEEILLALPVANRSELLPASREDGTTAVTYLWFSPDTSLSDGAALANEYAGRASAPADGLVGVTGPGPARWRQFEEINHALGIVEGGTVALIALVVGLTFRAVGAPLLTLFASGIWRRGGGRHRAERRRARHGRGRPGELRARRRRRARGQLRPLGALPPRARRPALPARSKPPLRRGDARPHHVRLPGPPRPLRPHLLRPLRRRRPPRLARIGLQRLRRRADLAGSEADEPARGDRRPPPHAPLGRSASPASLSPSPSPCSPSSPSVGSASSPSCWPPAS